MSVSRTEMCIERELTVTEDMIRTANEFHRHPSRLGGSDDLACARAPMEVVRRPAMPGGRQRQECIYVWELDIECEQLLGARWARDGSRTSKRP